MYNDMNQNQYPNQGQFQNQYQYQYPQQPPESPGFGVASSWNYIGVDRPEKTGRSGNGDGRSCMQYYIIYSRDYSYINWSINSFVVKKFLM